MTLGCARLIIKVREVNHKYGSMLIIFFKTDVKGKSLWRVLNRYVKLLLKDFILVLKMTLMFSVCVILHYVQDT